MHRAGFLASLRTRDLTALDTLGVRENFLTLARAGRFNIDTPGQYRRFVEFADDAMTLYVHVH